MFAIYAHTLFQYPNQFRAGKIIYLAASLIAAVRLARDEDWRNSPRVVRH